MLLKAINNGAVTSTGTVTCESTVMGGVLITTDNTNAGTVLVHRVGSGGKQILDISTITTMWITGPFSLEESDQLYYSVSGTGCSAQFYEWIT